MDFCVFLVFLFQIFMSNFMIRIMPLSALHLSLGKETGCGFQTKQRYRFGSFSMKMKLVGGDSAGVVTAFYMCSENGAGPPLRDEIDFEFLGNRTGEPYLIQTNVYETGIGGREMRHMLWFDPTEDYHTYTILWNYEHLVFFVYKVAIRVYKNNGEVNNFFPTEKPTYIFFSSIWNADEWATRGGLEARSICHPTRTSLLKLANGKNLTLHVCPPPPRFGGTNAKLGISPVTRK